MVKAHIIDTVSNMAVKDLLETCDSINLFTEEDLISLAIERAKIIDPILRFPEYKLIELWSFIAEQSTQADIGLLIGKTINPGAKGLLSSWVSQADTLSESLDIFRRHISLMNPSEHWDLHADNEVCTLVFSFNENKDYPSIAVERSMSALVSWGRVLSGNDFPLIQACFEFPRPTYDKEFISLFGHNIHFDMPQNSLKFDSEFLKLPITNGNQYLKNMIAQKAKNTLHELTMDYSVALKTKKVIEGLFVKKSAISISSVSSELGLSRQTLYRKLKEEGCHYKQLSENFRKEQALRLLRNKSESITSISLRLGFNDTSSFYKAFKRWFGLSPKAYIRSLEA